MCAATSRVDWDRALKVGYALLLSPVVGFVCAGLLLWTMKLFIRNRQLYRAPQNVQPPPVWIHGLLILTCTGVSFTHGSNDGQKGMGLIMVDTMPIAYALNRSLPPDQIPRVAALTELTEHQLLQPAAAQPHAVRKVPIAFVSSSQYNPNVLPALAMTLSEIVDQILRYGSMENIPA